MERRTRKEGNKGNMREETVKEERIRKGDNGMGRVARKEGNEGDGKTSAEEEYC